MSSKSGLPKLARPAQRALLSAGIHELKDFTKFTEEEVSDLHGMGNKALEQIKMALQQNRLWFMLE
jgi:DNA-directed RNA polymerase alpha subunit